MDKIDRLGWAAGISVSAYGLRIGIRVSDPEVLERVLNRLPPGWKSSKSVTMDRMYSLVVGGAGSQPNVRRFNLLYAGPARLSRTMDLDQLLEQFESDLRLYVAEWARRKLFVHTGVVGWRGRAIVIPGRSYSGKTTLVTQLVRAGATYYSDEYAVFNSRGRVQPYPTPLSVREETGDEARKYSVEKLGGTAGVKPLPVGMVVVTNYRPGSRWRPRVLSPGQAVLALLAHTVAARRCPEAALTTLWQAVSDAQVLQGARGEAEGVVASLLDGPSGVVGLHCLQRGHKSVPGAMSDAHATGSR